MVAQTLELQAQCVGTGQRSTSTYRFDSKPLFVFAHSDCIFPYDDSHLKSLLAQFANPVVA
jgi:hypothetical protein